jgi:hypothetical protein
MSFDISCNDLCLRLLRVGAGAIYFKFLLDVI